ncbi:MAG: hypothetical protein L0027_07575 [Candidatus Rokubacteria bacterium]|nr:hypothetical protein [Candidatus Rokubacteria bacterium]
MALHPWVFLLVAAALAGGCAVGVPPAKTPLEVREFQTYAFDTSDSKLVMKAMFNALQDDGYVVRNAVIDLGLITATKEIDLAPGRSGPAGGDVVGAIGGIGGFIVLGPQSAPAYRKIEVRDFTGNVTERDGHTTIRISFQRKVLDSRGQVVEVKPIEDPAFYRDFFSRMDKSVYLQRERL